jgi:hypothetical protein
MEFMSPEHVDAVNAIVAEDQSVRAACARLPRPRVVAYRLTNGPDGADVHWTASFADTLVLSLTEAPASDVQIHGEWADMIRSARANREGQATNPDLTIGGDHSVLGEIGPIMELARPFATLPVEFPDVPTDPGA